MRHLLLSTIAASAFAALSSTPAVAADWSGFYGGAHLGYADGEYELASTSGGTGIDVGVDGVIGGGQLGYNWQNGNTVYGLEFSVSNGPDGITPQGTSGDGWVCGSGDCNASIDKLGMLVGRYGWDTPNGLFYLSAGIAHGRTSGGIYNSSQQGSGSTTGGTVGVGFETMVSSNMSVKFDVHYVDLGDIPFGDDGGSGDFYGVGDFMAARVGLNWHF